MKLKLILTIIIFVVFGVGTYLYVQTSVLRDPAPVEIKQSVEVIVSPQNATSTVFIDSVNLLQDGYVVIRGSERNRLGQIIEISHFLEKGEHKNIQIKLGDFYEGGEDLIAMIYADTGDKSFSGLTKPYKDANGHMVATYVATGKPVPTSIMEPTVSFDKTMGMNMATVHYTNTGFEPKTLTVPVNTMVEFVNDSDIEMWVASNPHPQHDILPTFDEFDGVKKGEVYTYTFDKKGTWPYHDHINAAKEGVITVQ
jgi:plastocyanin